MKTNSALATLCYLTISLPCFADTFTLKDGTTLEGTIVSEAGDSYVLDVQVTKSIRDERKVLKTDVVKISREQADLKAFEALAKLVPTVDLMSADEYQAKIVLVQKFLKANPSSPKVKEAKAILATLEAEAAQVADGGIKFNGKMISPAEYQTNAYDLDARVQEARIRTLVSDNQFLPALRLYVDFDRDFRTTLSYGSLAPLMIQVIQNEVTEAKQALSTMPARIKERDLGLQRMTPEDRTTTEAAIQEETAAIEAAYKAEKDAKQKWFTTTPFHKASLEETVKVGQAEIVRLSAVKTVLGVEGGKAYREAYTAVNTGAPAAAVTAALATAKTALVPARYLAPLEAAAKGRK